MKINMMKVITNMTSEYRDYVKAIGEAVDFQEVRQRGERALGFLLAIQEMTNSMICMENNDFTGDMSEVEDELAAELYQKLAEAADVFGEEDKKAEYLKRRDMCRA